MNQEYRVLDSYQNEVTSPPGNESVEALGTEGDEINIQREADPYAEAAASYASDGMWDTDEDAEQVAGATMQRRSRARDPQGRWTKA
ncbi:MAG TPA: hypothetical protein VGM16_04540 [Gammaproteobacteria bacterium]|jgi:hypothetical protein